MVRKAAIYIVLFMTGTLTGLLACEFTLRLFYPQGRQVVETGFAFFVQYDPWLGWANKPGSEGLFKMSEGDRPSHVKINNHGYRGKEFPPEKPAGARRLIFIGDSVTFGYRIEEAETFSRIMAESLPSNYEVLNMGVIGYGTDQELILLRGEALKFSPDIVVVGFSAGNDIVDITSSARYMAPKPFFSLKDDRLALRNVPVPKFKGIKQVMEGEGIERIFMRHSHLYRFIAYRFWLRPGIETGKSAIAMPLDEGWRVLEAIIKDIKSLCEGAGSRLVFVIIPDGRWIEASGNQAMAQGVGYSRIFNEMLERNNIPYIDLWTSFLKERSKGEKMYIEGDPDHLNKEGNSLAAKSILAWMNESGLLEGRSIKAGD